MKRFVSALLVVILLAGSAAALTNKEYFAMKKQDEHFREADDRLNELWKELKSIMPVKDFKALDKNREEWVRKGRENSVKDFMNDQNIDRVSAYTTATLERITYLAEIRLKYVYGTKAVTRDKAMGILKNYLNKNGKFGKNHIIMWEDYEPSCYFGEKDDGESWMLRHAVDGEDMIFTLGFYYVRVSDGAIYTLDLVNDEIIPVEE
ncbi:MAG: hypothetical protein II917_07585 [Synergistaceae bacterium]|nr:hypothetical protein [Synergistaceae bacterium]